MDIEKLNEEIKKLSKDILNTDESLDERVGDTTKIYKATIQFGSTIASYEKACDELYKTLTQPTIEEKMGNFTVSKIIPHKQWL